MLTCRAKAKGDPAGWIIGDVVESGGKWYVLISPSIFPEAQWLELDPGTVFRSLGRQDAQGNNLFEGDVISRQDNPSERLEICYGRYGAVNPRTMQYEENTGFFLASSTTGDALPIGNPEKEATILGNIIDIPELKVL